MKRILLLLGLAACSPVGVDFPALDGAPPQGARPPDPRGCLIAPADPSPPTQQILQGMAVASAGQPVGWLVHQAHDGTARGARDALERCLAWGHRRILGPIDEEALFEVLPDSPLLEVLAIPFLLDAACPPRVRAARPAPSDQGRVAAAGALAQGLRRGVVLGDGGALADAAGQRFTEQLQAAGGSATIAPIDAPLPPGPPRALLLVGPPEQAQARLRDSLGPEDHAWLVDRSLPSGDLAAPTPLAGRVHGLHPPLPGRALIDLWEAQLARSPTVLEAAGFEATRLLLDPRDPGDGCSVRAGGAHVELPTLARSGRLVLGPYEAPTP